MIYLTSNPLVEFDPEEEKALIEQGNLFDRTTDKMEESRLRAMYDRSVAERLIEGS